MRAAAQRVLDGDDSADAVSALEGVLLNEHPGDERFEDLMEALALYAPGMGPLTWDVPRPATQYGKQ